MIHGRDRDSVLDQVETIKEALDLQDVTCAVLFSGRRFKQRGARYSARRDLADASAPASGEPRVGSSARAHGMIGAGPRVDAAGSDTSRLEPPPRAPPVPWAAPESPATDRERGPCGGGDSPLAREFLQPLSGRISVERTSVPDGGRGTGDRRADPDQDDRGLLGRRHAERASGRCTTPSAWAGVSRWRQWRCQKPTSSGSRAILDEHARGRPQLPARPCAEHVVRARDRRASRRCSSRSAPSRP